MHAELALDCRCDLGEGPIWDHRIGLLLFVDIDGHQVHTFEPSSRAHHTIDAGEYVSAIALASGGGYLVTLQHDIVRFDLEHGVGERLASVEADRDDTRFNDGYVDPRGRFWAGTLSLVKKPGQGALYCLDGAAQASRPLVKILDNVTNSNGIDWSPDERLMYYIDTGTRRIDVFDFDAETGSIANRRPLVTIPESDGKPDGLILDEEGFIWVALWQGSAVRRYSPEGRFVQQIELPVSCPTKCAFGGANLDELYITTAKPPRDTKQPQAGGVFVARPGVRGRVAIHFGSTT
ncbi:MAG: SMP-30/gluconolactonase/LRE family protein [Vicinamibacterales bacterium]